MKRSLLPGLFILVCVLLSTLSANQGDAGKLADPVWLSDYAAARQLAKATGKPLFLVFRCVP